MCVTETQPDRLFQWAPEYAAPRGALPCTAKRNRYIYGDCVLLALAVHARTGWPVVSVDMEGNCGHCMVRMPDGRLLDAAGPHDADTEPVIVRHEPWLPADLGAQRWCEPDVLADAAELVAGIQR